jgi:hypothetical protein
LGQKVTDSREPSDGAYPDEIELLLKSSGANAPEVDRLARIASDIRSVEWELARRSVPGEKKVKFARNGR